MIMNNLKTVALAASLITLFAACAKNHPIGSSPSAPAKVGELNQSVSQIEPSFDAADTTLSKKIAAVGIQSGDKKESLVNIDIKFVGSEDSVVLASIDDWSQLHAGKTVDLELWDKEAVTKALGQTPIVKAKCTDKTCAKFTVLMYSSAPSRNKVPALAGFVFKGNSLSSAQNKIVDLNAPEEIK